MVMGALRRLTRRLGRAGTYSVLTALLLLVMPLALPPLGVLKGVDLFLNEWRAAAAPRAAGGKFVFVAIDKASLDQIGVWPWPRDVHAQVIDRLVAAGAADIFLDIDFSTRSTAAADARLTKALADAGGGVALPAFVQYRAAADETPETVVSRPLSDFEANAWLAAANVAADADGVVRDLPLGVTLDGQVVQSVAALLAGEPEPSAASFGIDFSISPASVPVFSVSDLLSGRVPADALAGRSVVVGAYAAELKDVFAVPVYGLLGGPMLHILGAETLLQDRVPVPLDPTPYAVAIAGLLVLSIRSGRPLSGWLLLPLLGLTAAAVEGAAFYLQQRYSLVLPSAGIELVLATGLLLYLIEHVDIGNWLAALAQVESRNSQTLLRRVIDDSVDGVVILDHQGRLVEVSRSAETIFGPGLHRALVSDFSANAPLPMQAALERARRQKGEAGALPVDFELELREAAGHRHLEGHVAISLLETAEEAADPADVPYVACVTVRDVTAKRAYAEKLKALSQYDELTGALRRDELVRRMDAVACDDWSVFAINLHRFAAINMVLGRSTGDDLLKAVVMRLKENAPRGALVARSEGDGFSVAVPSAALAMPPAEFAEHLIGLLSRAFVLGPSVAEIGARIGICVSGEGRDPAGLVAGAEAALDHARKSVGSGYSLHDSDEARRQIRARALEAEMKGALAAGQFFLLYQPQVELARGSLTGAEALVRWRHPEFGVVPPFEFIEIAEASGFICELGAFVVEEACRQAITWPEALSVSVNVSPLQFTRMDMVAVVRKALSESGLSPERLHLEITESAFLDVSDEILAQLAALRALGVKIALDDFGTGYSSLGYLARFPLDFIKIDQSFVRRLATDPASLTIVGAVKSLAAGFGARVVCEGIEGETEWQMLAAMGCEEGQGYYFGKPQPGEDIRLAAARVPDRKRA
ncbi:EAL domain-containing protein [Ciceribacter thiooxidans]|uniref:EAL domain-containing protein n=1 Tax=Ciceribacter thiooxidans TaxID=1969821 RepID=A0ABV7I3E5_9HYPH|nr:EAL domain-containing protein [Ciceribacter thiooxidans]